MKETIKCKEKESNRIIKQVRILKKIEKLNTSKVEKPINNLQSKIRIVRNLEVVAERGMKKKRTIGN